MGCGGQYSIPPAGWCELDVYGWRLFCSALYCTLPALHRDSTQLIISPSFQSYQLHIKLYYVAGISIWVRFGVSPNEAMGATGTIVVADNKGATEDSYMELISWDTEYHLTPPLTSTLISLVYYLQKKLLLLLNSQVSHNLLPCTPYANCVHYSVDTRASKRGGSFFTIFFGSSSEEDAGVSGGWQPTGWTSGWRDRSFKGRPARRRA